MPIGTVIVVFGSWIVLFILTIVYFFATKNKEGTG